MPVTQHVCKFDPTHGVFPTPVMLRQHYDAEHADVYNPHEWRSTRDYEYACRLCPAVVRNPSAHIRNAHPDATEKPWTVNYFDRVGGGSTPQPRQAVDVVNHESDTAPRHVGPWSVDDIVLPVVEQLAKPSGKVPVSALAALFVWRDQTAAMLREVTGRNG